MTNHKCQSDLTISRKRKRKLALRKTLLLTALILIIAAIATPPLVSSVQNIFTNLGQITDIQYGGTKIDKVVYQGQTIWERQFPAMQDFTPAECSALTAGKTIKLKDNRDNKIYRVRKMADNRCWMIDNLAYDINTAGAMGKPAYNPTAQLVAGTTASVNTRAQYAANPSYTIPNNGNPTPSYLYNWCAAMGDTSANCTTTVAYTAGQPSTPQTGICPAPFRLPTVGATPVPTTQGNGTNQATASATTTNEFSKLDIWLGGTGINRTNANTYPNFTTDNAVNPQLFFSGVLNGRYNSGLGSLGTVGFWWSSTAYSSTNGYDLNVDRSSTNVYPSNNNSKHVGFAVRCIL